MKAPPWDSHRQEQQRRALRGSLDGPIARAEADWIHNRTFDDAVSGFVWLLEFATFVALMTGLLVAIMSEDATMGGLVAWWISCTVIWITLQVIVQVPQRLATRRFGPRRATDHAVAESDLNAWVATLPPVTLEGKRALTQLVLDGAADLQTLNEWVNDELERLERAEFNEAQRKDCEPLIQAIERGPIAYGSPLETT